MRTVLSPGLTQPVMTPLGAGMVPYVDAATTTITTIKPCLRTISQSSAEESHCFRFLNPNHPGPQCHQSETWSQITIPHAATILGIADATAGGSPMSSEIAARVIALFRRIRPTPPREEHHLTPHEIRVLKLLVDGHNYKAAAVELSVSVNTISFHMRRIYDKLHVHTKSEAVAKALRNQIIG